MVSTPLYYLFNGQPLSGLLSDWAVTTDPRLKSETWGTLLNFPIGRVVRVGARKAFKLKFVVSHISRKTSEMWGTRGLVSRSEELGLGVAVAPVLSDSRQTDVPGEQSQSTRVLAALLRKG